MLASFACILTVWSVFLKYKEVLGCSLCSQEKFCDIIRAKFHVFWKNMYPCILFVFRKLIEVVMSGKLVLLHRKITCWREGCCRKFCWWVIDTQFVSRPWCQERPHQTDSADAAVERNARLGATIIASLGLWLYSSRASCSLTSCWCDSRVTRKINDAYSLHRQYFTYSSQ